MPLVVPLPKLFSQKSPPRYAQSQHDTAQRLDGSSRSKKPTRVSSTAKGYARTASTGSTADRERGDNKEQHPKGFAFSLDAFNVITSIRTRSKAKDVCTRPESQRSGNVYSGYEDDEYGEQEAEAEEIRRPSGLGNRASIDLSATDVGDDHAEPADLDSSTTKVSSLRRSINEHISQPSISDSIYSESLAEIRYPSGLGNIKLGSQLMTKFERPHSTYPLFPPSPRDNQKHIIHSPLQIPNTLSRRQSSPLSALLPILFPYLTFQSLLSLTLVDRAVGIEARILLWREVKLTLSIDPTRKQKLTVDDRKSTATLLDVLSKGDVARLVKSLTLLCRLEDGPSQRHPHPHPHPPSSFASRARPPPLILPTRTRSARIEVQVDAPPEPPPAKPVLPPSPLPKMDRREDAPAAAAPAINSEEVALSRLRRASRMLRNSSISLRTNVPEALRASAAKLRPPGLNLSRSLSRLKASRSSELLGRGGSSSTERQSDSTMRAVSPADSDKLSHTPYHLPSRFQSPQIPPMAPADPPCAPSPSLPPTPSPCALAYTGWRPPSEWDANPSSSMLNLAPPMSPAPQLPQPHYRRLSASLSFVVTAVTQDTPSLRTSSSVPSMRGSKAAPATQPKDEGDDEEAGSGVAHNLSVLVSAPPFPAAALPSPTTPHSAISLSAFPLPPSTSGSSAPTGGGFASPSFPPPSFFGRPADTSPRLGLPGLRRRASSSTSSLSRAASRGATPPPLSPVWPPLSPVWPPGLPLALRMALEGMVNLERVVLAYAPAGSKGPLLDGYERDLSTSVYRSDMCEGNDLGERAMKAANDLLGGALVELGRRSLRSVNVRCPHPHRETACRAQWSEWMRAADEEGIRVTCGREEEGVVAGSTA